MGGVSPGAVRVITSETILWRTDTDWNKGTIPATLEVSGTGDAAVVQTKENADNSDNIPYTTVGNYTLSDGAKVDVVDGAAKLKTLTGVSKDYPFTTPGNYTFVAADVEVTGGNAQLKDQTPANATFHASYDVNIDGNYGDGILTGTATGGAAVSGGELDLTFSDNRYVTYDAESNADSQQVGCIRIQYRPDYTGTPAATQTLTYIYNDAGNRNRIRFRHYTATGQLQIYIQNFLGLTILFNDLGVWSPTSGVLYEMEVNFDITAGATRVFIDGTQFGATDTNTGVRDGDITTWHIGIGGASNFAVEQATYFDTVQHTANYTPAAIAQTRYAITNPTIVGDSGLVFTALLTTFTETATKTGSEIKYHISADNGVTWDYWTGAAWAVTDDTYAQSNTVADILANLSTWDASGTFKFRALLHSNDGSQRPIFDNLLISETITYSTDDDLYVDTKNASQIAPTDVVDWSTTTITSTLPASTDAKLLFSIDGRINWLTWGGSAWVAPASPTARANATSFTDATTNFPSLALGSGTLDVRAFVFSSVNTSTPTVENIAVTSDAGFQTAGTYETNQYDSSLIDTDWNTVNFSTIIPSGGSIVITTRAANSITELDAASYGSSIASGSDAGVIGEYVQFKIVFTGPDDEATKIDQLSVSFQNPVTDISPP